MKLVKKCGVFTQLELYKCMLLTSAGFSFSSPFFSGSFPGFDLSFFEKEMLLNDHFFFLVFSLFFLLSSLLSSNLLSSDFSVAFSTDSTSLLRASG